MNPISKVTGAITHPVRTATHVAGGALGVAAAGVRTATRIVGKAAGQDGDAAAPSQPSSAGAPAAARESASEPTPDVSPTLAVKTDAGAPAAPPVKKAPATKTAAKKAPAKKVPAEKAPATKTAAEKAPAKTTPAEKAPAKKTPAKKAGTTAKKAPSAKAATAGPAMALQDLAAVADVDPETAHVETETEVVYTSESGPDVAGPEETLSEPLVDPEVAEALQRLADPDQG